MIISASIQNHIIYSIYFLLFVVIAAFCQPAWTNFTPQNGLVNGQVYAFAFDASTRTWLGTYGGIASKLENSTFTHHDIRISPTPAYGGYAMAVDHLGNTWFGTSYGAIKYAGSQWTKIDTSLGLPDNEVRALVVDNSGTLWFGTLGGVTRYDGTNWQTYTTTDGLIDNQVFCLTIGSNGHIWAGSVDGISEFDGTTWKTYANAEGYTGGWTLSLAADRDGKIWAGPNSGGLWYYQNSAWNKIASTRIDNTNSISGVQALAIDSTGGLWCGALITTGVVDGQGNVSYTYARKLLRKTGTTWNMYDSSNGIAGNYIRAIAVDRNNTIWVGTETGASRSTTYTGNIDNSLLSSKTLHVRYDIKRRIIIELPDWGPQVRSAQIFSLDGTLVKALSLKTLEKGYLVWDGLSIQNAKAARGVYILQLNKQTNLRNIRIVYR